MEESQRRFKVLKIEEYKDRISTENEKSEKQLFLVLLNATLAINFISTANLNSINNVIFYINHTLGATSLLTTLIALKKMITSIANKSALELRKDELEAELSYDEFTNYKRR